MLYTDADMQKADWMTAAGTIVGVLCIGVGWWWGDAVAALFISVSIVRDGWTNLKFAVGGLMDQRARTYDDSEPDPLNDRIRDTLCGLTWVADARCRVRDMGHVFHVEAFVQGHEPGRDARAGRASGVGAAVAGLEGQRRRRHAGQVAAGRHPGGVSSARSVGLDGGAGGEQVVHAGDAPRLEHGTRAATRLRRPAGERRLGP